MKKVIVAGALAFTMLMPTFAMAQTVHHAFTPAQISAVIELLVAFGVDEATVFDVYNILQGA